MTIQIRVCRAQIRFKRTIPDIRYSTKISSGLFIIDGSGIFLWRKLLEAWHNPWHTLIFRKISKSTSSLISDRKLQFVSITLLANRMEPRSSCRFVLKIKYCPGLLYVGRIRHKNPASCWLDKLLLIFFLLTRSGICVLDKSESDSRQKFAQ